MCNNLLCCFGFLTLCGCRDRISRQMVFFPPPVAYCIEQKEGEDLPTMWLVNSVGQKGRPIQDARFSFAQIQTKKKKSIWLMHINHPESKFTILFSHGNATDIGYMRDNLIDMSESLRVSVAIYDYTGYGLSSGKPSVSNVYADAEAALNYLTETRQIPLSQIVLYGQSLGTAAATYIASKHDVAGVVLHSPLLSGVRVLTPVEKTYFFDIFPNVDLINKVSAPILIIHGTQDEEIPIHHGANLYEQSAQKYQPWFVDGAGHNDIEINFRPEYIERLALFLAFLEAK